MAEVVAIEQVEGSLLAAGERKMRRPDALIRQRDDSTGTKIDVQVVERTLIEGVKKSITPKFELSVGPSFMRLSP